MDSNDGIITIFFPIFDPDSKRKSSDHTKGHDNIIRLSDTSLYSYKDDRSNYVSNGLCIDKTDTRYCLSRRTHDKPKPIVQTILGDLISSIKILTDDNTKIKEENTKLKERIEVFEDNLRFLRSKLAKN